MGHINSLFPPYFTEIVAANMLNVSMRSASRRWNLAVVLLGIATLTVVMMVAVNVSARVHGDGDAVSLTTDPATSLADSIGNKLNLLKNAVPQLRRQLLEDDDEEEEKEEEPEEEEPEEEDEDEDEGAEEEEEKPEE